MVATLQSCPMLFVLQIVAEQWVLASTLLPNCPVSLILLWNSKPHLWNNFTTSYSYWNTISSISQILRCQFYCMPGQFIELLARSWCIPQTSLTLNIFCWILTRKKIYIISKILQKVCEQISIAWQQNSLNFKQFTLFGGLPLSVS